MVHSNKAFKIYTLYSISPKFDLPWKWELSLVFPSWRLEIMSCSWDECSIYNSKLLYVQLFHSYIVLLSCHICAVLCLWYIFALFLQYVLVLVRLHFVVSNTAQYSHNIPFQCIHYTVWRNKILLLIFVDPESILICDTRTHSGLDISCQSK